MDAHKLQLIRERESRRLEGHHNHNVTKHERLPPPPPPPSSSTSPSHDFSFTISLVPSPPPPPLSAVAAAAAAAAAASLDLAPADDIFLHGHLLPLQYYSLPSTHTTINTTTTELTATTTTTTKRSMHNAERPAKAKSLSSLLGLGRPKKPSEEEQRSSNRKEQRKLQRVFDVGRLLRRCMVEPIRVLMTAGGGDRERRRDLRRGQRPHSFSGHLNPPRDKDYSFSLRSNKRRRPAAGGGPQLSAPASMRTSPTNSGHLSAASLNMSSSDESTMDELHSAIQAAIAHCKNSIAAAAAKKA